jgi:FkbM family methyltransferase
MSKVKESLRRLGTRFSKHVLRRKPPQVGESALADMERFLPEGARPLILDVGANTGQSVKRYRRVFPSAIIHSFEPSQRIFDQLKTNVAGQEDVFTWNCGVGSAAGKQTFLENTHSDMSSFLELSKTGWGKIVKESVVDVTTVDQFMADHQIHRVDILKSDTQGYDFEVIKGAEHAMRRNAIGLLYFEFIFSEMYQNLPRFDEVFRHLTDRRFRLVSIYEIRHQENLASWADALFVNRQCWAERPTPTRGCPA